MAVNWKLYSVRDLSGGMNRAVGEFMQSKDEMRLIVNYDLDDIGNLKKIPGYYQRGSSVDGGTEVLGLTPFYYGNSQQQIVVINGASDADAYIYNPEDNDWDAESLSLSSGAKCEFLNYLDGLFMCNLEDDTYYYNGTTWSTTTNVTNAPKSSYITSYSDRVYLANLDVSGTTHPSRVAYSSLPDDSYEITWDMTSDGQYFDVSPKDGDEIMGLKVNFQKLLIFKEESLWRYDKNTLQQFPGAPGTNSQRTVKNVLGYTLYFHKTGIYRIDQGSVVKVSRAINDVIEGVKSINLARTCAEVNGDHYRLFVGDVENPMTGIEIDNCLIDFDVAKNKFVLESLDHVPRVFSEYRDDRSDVTYSDDSYTYSYVDKTYSGLVTAEDFRFFGDSSGDVWQLDDEENQMDSANISAYFETPNYYFAGIHRHGNLQALKIYVEKARRLRLYYSIDDKAWEPLTRVKDSDSKEIFYRFKPEQNGNRIKFKGIDNSSGEQSSIKGFDIFYTPTMEIE